MRYRQKFIVPKKKIVTVVQSSGTGKFKIVTKRCVVPLYYQRMLLSVGYCWNIPSFHGSIIRKHLLRLPREYWLYWPPLIVAYKGGLRGCAGLLRSGMVCRKPGVSGWGERSRSHQGTKMVDLHVILPKTETSENYLDTVLHNLTLSHLRRPSTINHWQCSEVTSQSLVVTAQTWKLGLDLVLLTLYSPWLLSSWLCELDRDGNIQVDYSNSLKTICEPSLWQPEIPLIGHSRMQHGQRVSHLTCT